MLMLSILAIAATAITTTTSTTTITIVDIERKTFAQRRQRNAYYPLKKDILGSSITLSSIFCHKPFNIFSNPFFI